jgi:hypothetical protein
MPGLSRFAADDKPNRQPAKIYRVEAVIAVESRIIRGMAIPGSMSRSNDRRYIGISVADNEIGFEQRYVDQIFLIFHRLHSRHEYPRTGIGADNLQENYG